MALRNIREIGEECLRCVCKEVTEINPRLLELIEDLKDTMYEASIIHRLVKSLLPLPSSVLYASITSRELPIVLPNG